MVDRLVISVRTKESVAALQGISRAAKQAIVACPAIGGPRSPRAVPSGRPRALMGSGSPWPSSGPARSCRRRHEKPLRSAWLGRGPEVGPATLRYKVPPRTARASTQGVATPRPNASVRYVLFEFMRRSIFRLRARCPAQGTRLLRFSIRRVKRATRVFSRVRREVLAEWLSAPMHRS